jgi:hypothetical protein
MCDHPESTIEEWLDAIRTTMVKHGWAVQYVESDSRPYAYTIGLQDRGLPELLVTGVSPQRAVQLRQIETTQTPTRTFPAWLQSRREKSTEATPSR